MTCSMSGDAIAHDSRASAFEFTLVSSEEEFRKLAAEWTALHDQSRPRNPFLSYAWTEGCWARKRGQGRLFIVLCRERGVLVGIAPLYFRRRLSFRLLRFIGEGSSDYLGFLRPADRPDVTAALVQHLQVLDSRWDLAIFRRLSPSYTDALDARMPDRLRSARADGPVAPYLRFAGDWEELLRSGPSQLRHTRRWARKFEREGGAVVRLEGAEAIGVIDELREVESKSWKKGQGLAWFDSPGNRALLVHALATLPGVEVWLARIEGRAIAYLVNFVTPERVMYYQGAYDDGFRKYYAGGLLHFHAINRAWNAGVREYDFLIGAEDYKSGWTNGEHSQHYLCLMPATLRGQAAFLALVAPRWFLRQFRVAHTAHAFATRKLAAVKGHMGGGSYA